MSMELDKFGPPYDYDSEDTISLDPSVDAESVLRTIMRGQGGDAMMSKAAAKAKKMGVWDQFKSYFEAYLERRFQGYVLGEYVEDLLVLAECLEADSDEIRLRKGIYDHFFVDSYSTSPVEVSVVDYFWSSLEGENFLNIDLGALSKLIRCGVFQSKYGNEARAKDLVRLVVPKKMNEGAVETYRSILAHYGMELDEGLARDTVCFLMQEGELAKADRLAKKIGYEITSEDFDRVREMLRSYELSASLFERECYEMLAVVRSRIGALARFEEYGMDLSRIPTIHLPEGYEGDFAFVEMQGRTLLTVGYGLDPRRSNLHKVYANFHHTLVANGFDGYAYPKGGGRVRFDHDAKIIVFSGISDLDPLDLDLIQALTDNIEVAHPGWRVKIGFNPGFHLPSNSR